MAPPTDLQATLERLTAALEKPGSRGLPLLRLPLDSREAHRKAKRERREARRKESLEKATVPGAVVSLVAAAAMALFAVFQLQYWWLLFVAFGIGSDGAIELSAALERKKALTPGGSPPQPQPVVAGPVHEIDALCNQLLADLAASPEVVRGFLQQPEKTVEALRAAAKGIDARRIALTAEGSKAQLAALAPQRQQLEARRDGTTDPAARAKFSAALDSLDGQEAALRQLTDASDRLDGEYSSLLVLLQEMKTRVAVARSAEAGSLEGLQQNVQRLNAELEAITASLQQVQHEGLVSPVDSGVAGTAQVPATAERVR
jgi:DNA repair exonuclease SbcCD ATPase subunit